MKVQFVKPWLSHRAGELTEIPNRIFAKTLIRKGYARAVSEEKATDKPPRDKQVKRRQVRKKGK